MQGPFDVAAEEGRDHERARHAHSLDVGGAEGQRLERLARLGEPAAHGEIDHLLPGGGPQEGVVMRFGVQQDGGDTPVVQHVVGAHARSAAGAVDGQEFEIQLGGHPYTTLRAKMKR